MDVAAWWRHSRTTSLEEWLSWIANETPRTRCRQGQTSDGGADDQRAMERSAAAAWRDDVTTIARKEKKKGKREGKIPCKTFDLKRKLVLMTSLKAL
ncbi:hypothetical protein Scep_024258 [Stephania cephalantha]|uniref:Uncharacterized protein n=1 Tax=Stephania cephalantha TaxID=152367 RepID=A0AAP0HTI7_9MAGN